MKDPEKNSSHLNNPRLTGLEVREVSIIAGTAESPAPQSTSDTCPKGFKTVVIVPHVGSSATTSVVTL